MDLPLVEQLHLRSERHRYIRSMTPDRPIAAGHQGFRPDCPSPDPTRDLSQEPRSYFAQTGPMQVSRGLHRLLNMLVPQSAEIVIPARVVLVAAVLLSSQRQARSGVVDLAPLQA